MNGVLLVDKPTLWTSFDVVNYVRKIIAQSEDKKPRQIKVGHIGTLDPMATGLLVLLIGKEYTRQAQKLAKLDKSYRVTMTLGETSSTGDGEGIISLGSKNRPTTLEVKRQLEAFSGQQSQVPPIYSAIKINGRRAYQLARQGKEPIMKPRSIQVNRLQLFNYEYPKVIVEIDVSSGTYIRSLVEAIGQALGTGAYTSQLRRTKVGKFSVDKSLVVENLSSATISQNLLTLE